jgi:hypothetical protein
MSTARRLSVLLALAVCGVTATAGAASAATRQVSVDGFTLQGSGPTIWDGANDDFTGGRFDVDGCSVRDGYSPVHRGASFEGRRVRTSAFDNGAMFGNGLAQIAIYPANGKGAFNNRTNTLAVGPTSISGLSMSRKDTATGGRLRSLIKLRNSGTTTVNTAVTWDSRMSLAGPSLATSSGDASFTEADRWLVEGPSTPPVYYDDQVVGFALFGKGANEKVATVDFGPPSYQCVTVDFEITVPAGETRYMLFFTEQHTSRSTAERAIAKYNRAHLSDDLLRGIPGDVRNKVLNWDL